MTVAAEFGTGQVLWSMMWFFLFFIYVWLLILVFGDIFRSRDLSGWGKALWTVFVIVMPYLGVFAYLVVRGDKVHEYGGQAAEAQGAAVRHHVQSVATPDGGGSAGEIAGLADLRDRGVISDAEFEQGKAKALR